MTRAYATTAPASTNQSWFIVIMLVLLAFSGSVGA
jgi:hypothetical protein